MAKVRKDSKGRFLHKGESFNKVKRLYCYNYTDSFGKRRFIYCQDLGELRQKEKQVQINSLDGINAYAYAKTDLNGVFDRYIETKTNLRSSTLSNYVYTYNRYVRNGFGKKKVSDLKYSDILLYYKDLTKSGLALSTVDSVHCLLHPALQMAVRDSVIRFNPSDGVMAEFKKGECKPEPRHALTLEEERAFLAFLNKEENIRWKPLFFVLFGTGCRIGEIIGLRWKDINFKDNTISINHSVTYCPRTDKNFKSEFRVDLPKTKSGIRIIPMLDKVKEAFKTEKDYQDENGAHCIMQIGDMNGFIFCNRYGEIHHPGAINKVIRRIVDDYNAQEQVKACRESREPIIVPRFSCHITRHTFCTRLCENETNIKVIQTVMGHKDIRTTLEIYAEVTGRKKQEVFKELNSNDVF